MVVRMLFHPLTLVVIGANVLGAAMAVPQALKLVADRSVAGVSSAWAGVSAIVNAWWGVYGFGVRDWGIVPVSVVSVTAYLLIIVALVRFDPRPRWDVLRPAIGTATAIGVIPLAVVIVGGWSTAGVVLGALYGVQLAPAVLVVYRVADVSAVAVATWVIAFAEAVLWGVYGFARLDTGLVALGATGVLMSSLVLARLFVRRSRRARTGIGYGLPHAQAFA